MANHLYDILYRIAISEKNKYQIWCLRTRPYGKGSSILRLSVPVLPSVLSCCESFNLLSIKSKRLLRSILYSSLDYPLKEAIDLGLLDTLPRLRRRDLESQGLDDSYETCSLLEWIRFILRLLDVNWRDACGKIIFLLRDRERVSFSGFSCDNGLFSWQSLWLEGGGLCKSSRATFLAYNSKILLFILISFFLYSLIMPSKRIIRGLSVSEN